MDAEGRAAVGTVGASIERTGQPRLRADASRNRERIVAAAREAFVEHGAEATLDEIARRAGVGNATIYRHFVDRSELIRQVIVDVMDRIVVLAETALAEEPDAFEALRRFVYGAAEEQIGAMCPMLSCGCEPYAAELAEKRVHLRRAVDAIMDRARVSGLLRPDVTSGDVLLALPQLTRPLPGTEHRCLDRFVKRGLQLLLDGMRAPARSPLPAPAPTFEDFQLDR
jgi:AcrR family transcriptional regulator